MVDWQTRTQTNIPPLIFSKISFFFALCLPLLCVNCSECLSTCETVCVCTCMCVFLISSSSPAVSLMAPAGLLHIVFLGADRGAATRLNYSN